MLYSADRWVSFGKEPFKNSVFLYEAQNLEGGKGLRMLWSVHSPHLQQHYFGFLLN